MPFAMQAQARIGRGGYDLATASGGERSAGTNLWEGEEEQPRTNAGDTPTMIQYPQPLRVAACRVNRSPLPTVNTSRPSTHDTWRHWRGMEDQKTFLAEAGFLRPLFSVAAPSGPVARVPYRGYSTCLWYHGREVGFPSGPRRKHNDAAHNAPFDNWPSTVLPPEYSHSPRSQASIHGCQN